MEESDIFATMPNSDNVVSKADGSVAENSLPVEAEVAPVNIAEIKIQRRQIEDLTEKSEFAKTLEVAKVNALREASASDEDFNKAFMEQLKESAMKVAEVEKEKAQLEKQNIEYHQQLLDKEQQLNDHIKKENLWANKEKRREYHYNGVKPIMEFVGIKEPMNLIVLYLLTALLTPFYLLNKFFVGTIGALIAGASDSNRPKAVKGFLLTLLCVVAVVAIGLAVLFVLMWLGIINF